MYTIGPPPSPPSGGFSSSHCHCHRDDTTCSVPKTIRESMQHQAFPGSRPPAQPGVTWPLLVYPPSCSATQSRARPHPSRLAVLTVFSLLRVQAYRETQEHTIQCETPASPRERFRAREVVGGEAPACGAPQRGPRERWGFIGPLLIPFIQNKENSWAP
jgi:hypothetical protein